MPRMLTLAIVCVVSLLLGATEVALADPPLVAQWHLDTAMGNGNDRAPADLTPDSGGAGHDLLSCGGCIQIDGGGRYGGYLPATNVDGVPVNTVPLTTDGLRLPNVTVLAWIKRTGAPGSDQVIAAQAYDDATCDLPSYRLEYDDGDVSSGIRFAVQVGGSVVSSPSVSYPGAFDGQWHLVAGTYDGTKVRTYIDGNELGTGTAATGPIQYGTRGFFGADGFTGNRSGCFTRTFSGGIDELRVYSRALNSKELGRMAYSSDTSPPALLEDRDADGRPDTVDNCPDVPNFDQVDDDHNGVGAACQPVVAKLKISPNPTCTDVRNTFDGTASSSDSPITSYSFSWEEFDHYSVNWYSGNSYPVDRTVRLPGPVAHWTYYWEYPGGFDAFHGTFFPAGRRYPHVTLTVKTARGQTATDSVDLVFAQRYADQSRSGCPATTASPSFHPPAPATVAETPNGVSVQTTCKSAVKCLGVGSLTAFVPGIKQPSRAFAKAAKGRRVVIGATPYTIKPGKQATIKIRLNRRGKRLLKRRHKLKTTLSLRTVSPKGKTLVTSKRVTLGS